MEKQLKTSSCNVFLAILSEARNAVGATIHVRRQENLLTIAFVI
jgi:hypothetical protein